jgi:5'-nucleotidase
VRGYRPGPGQKRRQQFADARPSVAPADLANGFISVNGTPTDCVHLGLNGLLERSRTWWFPGSIWVPTWAMTCCIPAPWRRPSKGVSWAPFVRVLAVSRQSTTCRQRPISRANWSRPTPLDLPPRTVLNVNIPNLPLEHIRGIQLTRLGHRARAAAPMKVVDPRGKAGYWIAAAGDAEDGGPGTDFHAVMQGYVSITPLQLDRTFNDAFRSLDGWLEGLR